MFAYSWEASSERHSAGTSTHNGRTNSLIPITIRACTHLEGEHWRDRGGVLSSCLSRVARRRLISVTVRGLVKTEAKMTWHFDTFHAFHEKDLMQLRTQGDWWDGNGSWSWIPWAAVKPPKPCEAALQMALS